MRNGIAGHLLDSRDPDLGSDTWHGTCRINAGLYEFTGCRVQITFSQ